MIANLPQLKSTFLSGIQFNSQEKGGVKTAVSTIDAAVILCDQYLTLIDDYTARHWAIAELHRLDPNFKVSNQAQIEVIVGHDASSHDVRTNMVELLQLMMKRTGLSATHYHISFLEGLLKRPQAARVWFVTAVRQ